MVDTPLHAPTAASVTSCIAPCNATRQTRPVSGHLVRRPDGAQLVSQPARPPRRTPRYIDAPGEEVSGASETTVLACEGGGVPLTPHAIKRPLGTYLRGVSSALVRVAGSMRLSVPRPCSLTHLRPRVARRTPIRAAPCRAQALPALHNPIGVHALTWVGGWSETECIHAALQSSKLGYDLVEVKRPPKASWLIGVWEDSSDGPTQPWQIPLLEPATVDPAMTKRIFEEHGMQCATSLGLTFDADVVRSRPLAYLRLRRRYRVLPWHLMSVWVRAVQCRWQVCRSW